MKIKQRTESRSFSQFFHDFHLQRLFESSRCQKFSQGVPEISKSCSSSLGSPFRKPNEEPCKGTARGSHPVKMVQCRVERKFGNESQSGLIVPLDEKKWPMAANLSGILTCCKRKQDRSQKYCQPNLGERSRLQRHPPVYKPQDADVPSPPKNRKNSTTTQDVAISSHQFTLVPSFTPVM